MFIDVNDFSGYSCDSDMIQAALDAAYESGEAVVIPKINKRTGADIWEISKTVFLHSGSTLILQNAHLRMADGVICNMFCNDNVREKDGVEPWKIQQNITIKGIGNAMLDGGIHNGFYETNGIARTVSTHPDRNITENCLMIFLNVENLLIDHITIKNQRYWAVWLNGVVYSRVANIRFMSDSNVPNQDGVDVATGCHNVIVENITGCVGDNIVCVASCYSEWYDKSSRPLSDGDVHDVIVRNLLVYGVGGCSLVRILNHDGHKIYNVKIDNLIEASPWSEKDAAVAPNPDLNVKQDENGNIYSERVLVPGEQGYRCEAAVIIGESYWYKKSKAQPGDTFGISVSNIMTHARYGLFINNVLAESSFDNIRMFGNGFSAVYFGAGQMENLHFSNISYDKDCRPLPDDEHINIEWSKTRSDGFHCVYFNGTKVNNITFKDMYCSAGMDAVFGGFGEGNVTCRNIEQGEIPQLSNLTGIDLKENR